MVTGVVTILQKEIPLVEFGGGHGARLEQAPGGPKKFTATVSTSEFSDRFKAISGTVSEHGSNNTFQTGFTKPGLSC